MPNVTGSNKYWEDQINDKEVKSFSLKEEMIEEIKVVNKMKHKTLFGKPHIGRTIQLIVGSVIFVVAITLITLSALGIYPKTPESLTYSLIYETNGGSFIDTVPYDPTVTIELPANPTKEGYIFAGWFLDDAFLSPVTASFISQLQIDHDVTFYAKWVPIGLMVTVSFNSMGGSTIDALSLPYNSDLSSYVPIKSGLYFAGWFTDTSYQKLVTNVPDTDLTLYAFWLPFDMEPIGSANLSYEVPVGSSLESSTVQGGYLLATTETTYAYWYEVLQWALNHGYTFQNLGREGNDGIIGASPSTEDQPVVSISWLDTVVWLNALSEMNQLEPVYRDSLGNISRDSTIIYDIGTFPFQSQFQGFRLPSNNEWEMAARWTNGEQPDGYYTTTSTRSWKNGIFINDAFVQETNPANIAWYQSNSSLRTHAVGTKNANELGLYDMSGNVSEWTDTWANFFNQYKSVRGGNYNSNPSYLNLATVIGITYNETAPDVGFRIAMGNNNS